MEAPGLGPRPQSPDTVESISGSHCPFLPAYSQLKQRGVCPFKGFWVECILFSGILKKKIKIPVVTISHWFPVTQVFISLKDPINFESCSKIFIEQVKEKHKVSRWNSDVTKIPSYLSCFLIREGLGTQLGETSTRFTPCAWTGVISTAAILFHFFSSRS